ncbi:MULTISPECIES: hypothetical protein [Clostridia]|uniref:hypothetical protein n=1 Tax=Clostridia TaxID=186801 RepID=UPI0011C37DF8|nr:MULTISPECIES: hypothetical protein [Clostridia]
MEWPGEVPEVEKILTLIKQAPGVFKKLQDCFPGKKDKDFTIEDILITYVEEKGEFGFGLLGEILYEVIKERENISLSVKQDLNLVVYLLYIPHYPWEKISNIESSLTEEKLSVIYRKYLRFVVDPGTINEYIMPGHLKFTLM